MVDTSARYDELVALYGPVALAVLAIVFGAVLLAILLYHERPGDGRRPSSRHHAPVAEGIYVAGLLVVAVVLLAATFRTETAETATVARPGLEVDVTASKWRWRFDYPRYGVSEVGTDTRDPTLFVPTGTPVRIRLRSLDVVHAFWVEELRVKRDAYPGAPGTLDLLFPRPGHYTGRCAEFCGERHAYMNFDVEALRPEAFDRLMKARQP